MTLYHEPSERQLNLWVNGISIHLSEEEVGIEGSGGQCCPDFSCCHKHLSSNLDDRAIFKSAMEKGDLSTVNSLLRKFYTNAFGVIPN